MVPSSFCESPGLRSQWEGIDLYRIGDSGKGRVVDCLPLVVSCFQSTSAPDVAQHSEMELSVELVALAEIVRWRDFYREEMHCQIIHDSIHSRPGWSLEYRLSIGANRVGYASVAMAGPWKDNPTIYEYYVIPQFRNRIFDLFSALIT